MVKYTFINILTYFSDNANGYALVRSLNVDYRSMFWSYRVVLELVYLQINDSMLNNQEIAYHIEKQRFSILTTYAEVFCAWSCLAKYWYHLINISN